MKNIDAIKKSIQQIVKKKLSAFEEILSATIVGSFIHKTDISIISDIDVVVIVDKLNKKKFEAIVDSFKTIRGIDCSLPDYTIIVNSSFGPLKFNSANTIVFHVMVYDAEGHRKHVIESPFTCQSWENYPPIIGKSLSEIYPTAILQLEDMLYTRRGLSSYIADIDKKYITYRAYNFEGEKMVEIKNTYALDDRHQKEYAYHIIKYLMFNLWKILAQKNIYLEDETLVEALLNIDLAFEPLGKFLLELYSWKYASKAEPENIIERVKLHINEINLWLQSFIDNLPELSFIRHGKTMLNDGSFLGIHRDPSILPTDKLLLQSFDIVYTSILKRTIETAALLDTKKIVATPLLNEMNYGLAEGLTYPALAQQFPAMINDWNKKLDPAFPEGENQDDVAKRIDQFLNDYIYPSTKKKIGVVSHNVVIRIVIARALRIALHDWYKILPNHLEAVRFKVFNNTLIPALTPEQRIKFKEQALL